eukprot:CAMPEP_0184489008 /NCGR_PEP_ID=MMETSP0113_2-20130426/14111_1 /TAXON_ID=91329 /ORGANISM="Norrisiella sphaerica, Strain BC52" /LENGTH=336 /DNA_ID=CAMNT_0026872177 /DNA_START=122 /DNA_END=1132 /DNA_ORIENTATION=+
MSDGGSKEGWWYTFSVIALLLVVCAESVAFSNYNKYVFLRHNLPAPVFYTATCQILSFCGAVFVWMVSPPWFYKRAQINSTASILKILLVPIGFVMNYGMNNLSLKFATVTVNQLIRSFAPVVVATTSYFIEGKVQSWPKLISLCFLVLGVVVGVGTSPDFEIMGTMICAGSLVGNAISIVMTAFVMGDANVKLKPIDVMLYTTMPSVVILLPWSYSLDELTTVKNSFYTNGGFWTVTWILVGGLLACTYTFLYVLLIKLTSSVYFSVSGGFRTVAAIVVSFFIFPQQLSLQSVTGIVIAMGAFIANSYFTLKERVAEIDQSKDIRKPLLDANNKV